MSDGPEGWLASDGRWYPPPLAAPLPGQQPNTIVQNQVVVARTGCLSVAGNLIWFFFVGWWLALGYLAAAALMFLLVVTIPFGVQSAKLAVFVAWPFGRAIVSRPDQNHAASGVGNILWIVLAGAWLAVGHVVASLLMFVTIVGIPFGVKNLQMARLAIWPFGQEIVPAAAARAIRGSGAVVF